MAFCPRISFAEARQQEIVMWVIGYTRNRGVGEHWRTMLLPAYGYCARSTLCA